MSLFSTELQNWYAENARSLPWRATKNPYFIWLSEVILQQTRVQQGKSYYHKFVERFPNVTSLAQAEEQTVLNFWQGLGYYSRARNMHKTAKFVAQFGKGHFPNSHAELLKLPGVGTYTASAIASFAFDLPHAVVDGNVYRVLSRYLLVDEYIDSNSGQKLFQKLADELLDRENPAIHNQAIMELGALICTPKNPQCAICPVQQSCAANSKNLQLNMPRKKGKVKVKNRTLNYFVHQKNDAFLIQKRGEKDIWANMYEFPLTEGEEVPAYLLDVVELIKTVNHKLTHQNLTVNFFDVKDGLPAQESKNAEFVQIDELKNLPLPRVIEKYLEEDLGISVRI